MFAEPNVKLRSHGMIATHRTSFTFMAKTCYGEMTLALTTTPFNSQNADVKIVLGTKDHQETKIFHRADNGTMVEYSLSTPNVLDCHTMRPFWVSWDKGFLQFGRGYTMEDAIVSPMPVGDITGLSLSAFDNNALWSFSHDEGKCVMLYFVWGQHFKK